MTVGTDTYVTAAEADEYIAGHYRGNSKARQRWNAVSDADKAVLLVQAASAIEEVPFRGRKAIFDQPMAFPRLPIQYGTATGAPEKVKAAQIELALWLSDDDARGGEDQRAQLQAAGVQSYSIGDLSESYAPGGNSGEPAALRCQKCRMLLAGHIAGSVQTC